MQAEVKQGVVKLYDPATGDGVIISDSDRSEYNLAPAALEGSVFRMLRPGQRVVFDVNSSQQAEGLRLGSEVDMATPEWLNADNT